MEREPGRPGNRPLSGLYRKRYQIRVLRAPPNHIRVYATGRRVGFRDRHTAGSIPAARTRKLQRRRWLHQHKQATIFLFTAGSGPDRPSQPAVLSVAQIKHQCRYSQLFPKVCHSGLNNFITFHFLFTRNKHGLCACDACIGKMHARILRCSIYSWYGCGKGLRSMHQNAALIFLICILTL